MKKNTIWEPDTYQSHEGTGTVGCIRQTGHQKEEITVKTIGRIKNVAVAGSIVQ